MTDVKFKTIIDLKKALEDHGMDAEAINSSLEMVAKAAGTKYMLEMYAAVPVEVISKVQVMDKDLAAKTIHEAYFEKTGVQATDRLDEIISLTVEDMIAKPADFFQKKTK